MLPFDIEGSVKVEASPDWSRELETLGIGDNGTGGAVLDLAVGGPSDLSRLLSRDANAILIEGGGGRLLKRAGYRVSVYVSFPDPQRPRLVVAPKHGRATVHALRTRINPSNRLKKMRRDAASAVLRHAIVPPILPRLSIGCRTGGDPFLVLAAQAELGIRGLGWYLVAGSGDALSRGVFFLFAPGSSAPDWVLKFSRVLGYDDPFRREESALRGARAVGRVVTAHAPWPVARVDVRGRAATLESAAQGQSLDGILHGRAKLSEKVALVSLVVDWLLELAHVSRAPTERLEGYWKRLRALADRGSEEYGIPITLPDTPFFEPVLQHNDLGPWNILSSQGSFVAVDWESSRRYGAPLWDLWYFLLHALPLLEQVQEAELDTHVLRLLRGEAEWSHLFFRATLEAADGLGVKTQELGLLATLCWLHHSHSHPARKAALAAHVPGANARASVTARLPGIWLQDEGLGLRWRCLLR